MKRALMDAILAAWVRGWYAGLGGQRTDEGKLKDGAEIFRNLMKDLGLHEEYDHNHIWGFWADSIDKPGLEYRMCDKCAEMEYRPKI